MTLVVYSRSPDQIRNYRTKKFVFGLLFLPVSLYFLASGAARAKHPATPPSPTLAGQPIVATDEAMRNDFPIRWASGKESALRGVGKHRVFGVGPANTQVAIYQSDKLVTRSKTDAKGRWKAQIAIAEPGVKLFRAEFRRKGIGAGRSAPLSITLIDPKGHENGDVAVTNLAPNDRVIAGSFTLRGSAPPGDFVQVYVDATLLGRTEVDLAGRWSFKPKISGGGRRTFTIVDEISAQQFGPLPIFVVGKNAKAKPTAKIAGFAQGTPLR